VGLSRTSFDPFSPLVDVSTLFERDNTQVDRRKQASKTLPGNPSHFGPSNQSDFGFAGFGSLNILPSHVNSSNSDVNSKRLSYSSDGVNAGKGITHSPPGLSAGKDLNHRHLNSNQSHKRVDAGNESCHPLSLYNNHASSSSSVPISSESTVRSGKTSTWPMKQNQPFTLLPSSGSTHLDHPDNNNWPSAASSSLTGSSGYESSERGSTCIRDDLSFAESILGPLHTSSCQSIWNPTTPSTLISPEARGPQLSLFSYHETNNNNSLLDKNF